MISDLRARKIATAWHSGQWSPLYALSSSGAIVDGIIDEILDCQKHALSQHDWLEYTNLENLQAYVEYHDFERQPVEGWSNLIW